MTVYKMVIVAFYIESDVDLNCITTDAIFYLICQIILLINLITPAECYILIVITY